MTWNMLSEVYVCMYVFQGVEFGWIEFFVILLHISLENSLQLPLLDKSSDMGHFTVSECLYAQETI